MPTSTSDRMTSDELITICKETGLSPEELAPRLGISNMTYRRWLNAEVPTDLSKGYRRTAVEGIYELVIAGKLQVDSKPVGEFLKKHKSLLFDAAISEMGLEPMQTATANKDEDAFVFALAQVGSQAKKQKLVDSSKERLSTFEKMGAEWKEKVSSLRLVIASKELSLLDKLVAYGALFYLITPFDLIPDYIPVFGCVDDFGVLCLAAAYYARRYTKK